LIIGLVAAAFLAVLIPDSFFTRYIGSPWLEMFMILAASVPLYVCATGSIPIAAVFMLKGLSPGAALVFLMAGPATNVATMTVIGKTMGKKALFIYLLSIIGGAVAFGTIVNELLPSAWFTGFSIMDHEHGFLPEWIKLASAILLAGVSILAAYSKWIKPKIRIKTMNDNLYTTIKVEGMTCNHCKATVERNIEVMDGVKEVEADISDGTVRIRGNARLNDIKNVLSDLGYKNIG
jgi:copper chaperone CopZ